MARTAQVHSATSQFFINLAENTFLDHRDDSPQGFGYCVFGRVVEGMEVVDAIAALPTGPGGPFPAEVPQKPVVILKAELLASSPAP
jgi:peptidyl-prolyl cis-trans isomerase A (cyclophilin A)/peptidyl-prolyl cis-trans isomerase B (cyclophilin B)